MCKKRLNLFRRNSHSLFEIEKMQKLPIKVEVGTLQVVRIQYCTLEFLFLYIFLFWAFLKRFFSFFFAIFVLLFTLVQLIHIKPFITWINQVMEIFLYNTCTTWFSAQVLLYTRRSIFYVLSFRFWRKP